VKEVTALLKGMESNMSKHIEYLENVTKMLKQIGETQSDAINKAIDLMFYRFQKGGSLFVFGASHAGIIAEEMFYRAGGLMVINPIFSPTLMLNTRPVTVTSAMERLEGFGEIVLDGSPIKTGDVLIIHSVSGRNGVTIDMAQKARKMGIAVIVITNLEYSTKIPSRHSSGKNLYELGDVVIDNCGAYGDASVTLGDITAGPTSTVTGAAIANMLSVGFAQRCTEHGITPPVFASANLDTDKTKSEEIMNKYMNRIHYM